jgi:hypothetical protein
MRNAIPHQLNIPQNEVHDKKRPNEYQGRKIHPWPCGASGVINLEKIKQNKIKNNKNKTKI